MMFCAMFGHMVSRIAASLVIPVAAIMAVISSVAFVRPVCMPPRGRMMILNSLRGMLLGMRAAFVRLAVTFLAYCALVGGDLGALLAGLPGVGLRCFSRVL